MPKKIDIDVRDYPIDREKKYMLFPGRLAFDLKSTLGLPIEIVIDECWKAGFVVDLKEYQECMEEHRRASQGEKLV